MNSIRTGLGEKVVTCNEDEDAERLGKIGNITVEVKVANSFFDAKNYAESGQLSYGSSFTKTNILPLFGQVKQYFIEKIDSTLFNYLLYDAPWLEGQKFTTYTVLQSDFAIQELPNEEANNFEGYVNYRYTQSDRVQEDKFVRPTLASFLWVIGGFLSLVTRLTNFSLAGYQAYTIDKSLIKKVFSSKE